MRAPEHGEVAKGASATPIASRHLLFGLIALLLGASASAQQWHSVPAMNKARYGHTATLLPTGEVLVAGGGQVNVGNVLPGALRTVHQTTELFTAGGFWRNGPDMLEARRGHTATLLPNGELLVVGGTATPSAEIYSPTSESWRPTAAPAVARTLHTATLLRDGRVFVAGGSTDGRVEIYDPATSSWSVVSGSNVVRVLHTSTLLPDGRVLLLGGLTDPAEALPGVEGSFIATWFSLGDATSELFDPSTDTLTVGPTMANARIGHSAVVLHDLRLVVLDGALFDPLPVETMDATNPSAGFTNLSFDSHGGLGAAQLLPTGDVLLAAGDTAGLGFWDGTNIPKLFAPGPTGDMLIPLTPIPTTPELPGRLATLTSLPSGKLLLAGGIWGNLDTDATVGTTPGAWIFDPEIGWEQTSWQTASSNLISAHFQHTVDLLSSGNLLLVSGTDGELIDLSGPEPAPAPAGALAEPRQNHTATVLPIPSALGESRVLLAGGEWNNIPLGSVEVYGGESASPPWTSSGNLLEPRSGHTATLLPSGQILFAGGTGTGSAEIYDPGTGTTRPTGAMSEPRSGHSAQLLPSGEVLVGGGSQTYLTEIFDPDALDSDTGRKGSWRDHYDLAAPRFLGPPFLGLLPSQEPLIAGSFADGTFNRQSEILTSGGWLPAGALSTSFGSSRRVGAGATSLPTGQVFLSEGEDLVFSSLMTDVFFDVQTFSWTDAPTHSPGFGLSFFALNVAARDWVVKSGGCDSPAPVGTPCSASNGLQYRSLEAVPYAEAAPTLTTINGRETAPYPRLGASEPLVLEMPRPAIDLRSGGGRTNGSDHSAPLFRLESLESGQSRWLVPTDVDWDANPQVYTFDALPPGIGSGWVALSVTARGRISERYLLNVRGNVEMLRDGFETGDSSAWSRTVP
ncbi:MAG: hypothetical protein AAGK22_27985 [Acidobacteriota bacterium]